MKENSMFTKKKTIEPTPLDEAIDAIFAEMTKVTSGTKEYAAMADQLVKLMKLRNEIQNSKRLSPDTIATIAANLLGIVMIIGHERASIITTKAFGLLAKLR
jgi:hypothetical protein